MHFLVTIINNEKCGDKLREFILSRSEGEKGWTKGELLVVNRLNLVFVRQIKVDFVFNGRTSSSVLIYSQSDLLFGQLLLTRKILKIAQQALSS